MLVSESCASVQAVNVNIVSIVAKVVIVRRYSSHSQSFIVVTTQILSNSLHNRKGGFPLLRISVQTIWIKVHLLEHLRSISRFLDIWTMRF